MIVYSKNVRWQKGGRKTRRKIRGGGPTWGFNNLEYINGRWQRIGVGGRKTRRKTRGGSLSSNFNNPYFNSGQ